MAYDDKIFRNDRQMKVMINTPTHDRLKSIANSVGLQTGVLCRDVIEAFLLSVQINGKLPLGLDPADRQAVSDAEQAPTEEHRKRA